MACRCATPKRIWSATWRMPTSSVSNGRHLRHLTTKLSRADWANGSASETLRRSRDSPGVQSSGGAITFGHWLTAVMSMKRGIETGECTCRHEDPGDFGGE